ncbi:immune-induced peptides [Drosophila teissieri]|uniref:immune-induced peptides n=1 Tax=Drosophila teissieri TaxID=7243 RepID=UPI001CBA3796|nr:immune-induced peptides [Drosophila teissieri]
MVPTTATNRHFITPSAADPQQIYDGHRGPLVFGTPGNQVYFRRQNDGVYKVPGVGGQFQHASSQAEYVYTDKQGNSYRNIKQARGPAHLPHLPTFPYKPAAFHVTQPGRIKDVGFGRGLVHRNTYSLQFHEERSGRPVDFGYGEFVNQRTIPDGRVQDVGAGRFSVRRNRRRPSLVRRFVFAYRGQAL